MRIILLSAAVLLLVAGCTADTQSQGRGAQASLSYDPSGRPIRPAPDTPPGVTPAPGYVDNAIDTDPQSPRYQARGEHPMAPFLTQ